MHVLLINVPSRRGKGGMCLPLGLLYVGGILERAGHIVEIFDPYCNDVDLVRFDLGDYAELDAKIQEFNPAIIAFGGIASSYGRTKKYPYILIRIIQKYSRSPAVLSLRCTI